MSFQVADLNVSPLPPGPFKCVLAHDSLHHILDLDSLLSRVSTVLVPEGALVVMDFVGMGPLRKLGSAFLFALLPTFQPYRQKWRLRRRIRSYLSSEKRKRQSIDSGTLEQLNPDSPFEEISGKSIPKLIRSRYAVEEYFTFLPFWYYLAPKIRLPHAGRYAAARLLRLSDNVIVRAFPNSGAYFFLVARPLTNDVA